MIQASLVTADHSGEDAGDGETSSDRKGGAEAGQERVLGGPRSLTQRQGGSARRRRAPDPPPHRPSR